MENKAIIAIAAVAVVAVAAFTRRHYEKQIDRLTKAHELETSRTFFSAYTSGWNEGSANAERMSFLKRITKKDQD